MNKETIDQLAFSLLRELDAAHENMDGVNDYGEPTGLCDEHDLLRGEVETALSTLRLRAIRLKRRALANRTKPATKP